MTLVEQTPTWPSLSQRLGQVSERSFIKLRFVLVHTHTHAHVHKCTHTNTHTHMTCAHTHTHTHTHTHEYTHTNAHTHKHTQIHTHEYTHTHTHTHTLCAIDLGKDHFSSLALSASNTPFCKCCMYSCFIDLWHVHCL